MKKKTAIIIISILVVFFLLSITHILDFSKKNKKNQANELFNENLSKIDIVPKNRYIEIEKNEKNFILVKINLSEENYSNLDYEISYLESSCNISKENASKIILNPLGKFENEGLNRIEVEVLNNYFDKECSIRYQIKIYSQENLDERDFFDIKIN